jgi:hypothetical protein
MSAALKAQTYYISSSGNDNSAGTSAGTAWKTISKLNTINLPAGATVLFEGGKTFPGSIYLDLNDGNNSSSPLVISSYGNGKAIILSENNKGLYAYNTKGITLNNLIFEGSGMMVSPSDGVKFYADLPGNIKLSNIKVMNTEIRNYGKVGLFISSWNGNTGFKDVLIDNVHVHHVKETGIFTNGFTSQTHIGWAHQNVIIRNSEADNIPGYADATSHRGSGIILAQVDNGLIEKTNAHHTGSANTHCGGPGGIWVYDCNNLVIQHCESYLNSSGTGCDGLGFDLDGGITNSVLQYNYSHDNDGAGYLLGQYDNARPWSNNVVRYNISENDGRTNAGGITLFKGMNTVMNGCRIYNNTVFVSPSQANVNLNAFSIVDWHKGMSGIEVYNNIFMTSGAVSLIHVPQGYNAFFAGNIYWTFGAAFKIDYQGTVYTQLSTWRTATGNEQLTSQTTGIVADPLLINVGGGAVVSPSPTHSLNAYMTGAGSPALNAALDLNALFAINTGTVDFFNNPLPAGNSKDIGAHEKPVLIITAMNEELFKGEKITFYPNPLNAGEALQLKGGVGPYHIELYNIAGMLIATGEDITSAYYFPTNVLPGAIYIVKITDARGLKQTGKIVIR